MMRAKVIDIAEVTDFVASGSFASLRENVQYLDNDGFAYLIRLTDFNNNWKGPFVYVSESSYNFLKKSNLSPRDLIISNVGAYCGKCFLAPKLDKPITVGPNSIVVRSKSSEVNQDFLYYLFTSEYGQNLIKSIVEGSAIPKFNKTNFRNLEVELPELKIQLKAVEILKALDNKIDLNNQMNETLESMAKAIFKEWFIDFGPVRAKAEGRRPFGMDDETAALFPDSFEDSELGPIPKGWRVVKFRDIVTISRGSSPRPIQEFIGNDVPWFKIADATATSSPFIFQTKEKIKKEGENFSVVVEPGDLIVSNSATCGIPKFVELRGCVHDGWLVFKNFKVEKIYLYLSFIFINNHLNQIADGSVQKNLNTNIVGEQNIILPSKKIVNKFSFKTKELFELILNFEKEKIYLVKLRDLLLPKLISGEISLSNKEISPVSNETTTHIPFQQKDSA